MSFLDIFVRDKYSGRIHRVGDNTHDMLWVDQAGTIHYYNMQNSDGCIGYQSINEEKESDGTYAFGYEFVPIQDGELAEPYASQYKAQKEKAKEWDRMVEDLRKRTAQIKPDEIPEDL